MPRLFRLSNQSLVINAESRVRRAAFCCIFILITWAALWHVLKHMRAALLVRGEPTTVSCDRAIALDPNNGELWWIRGRIRHYAMPPGDLQLARRDYQRAVDLNPRLGQAWMDLADCLQRLGDFAGAERSLQRAVAVWAYSPGIHWQAGNLYLLQGRLEPMYKHFRTAVDYDISKLEIALQVSMRADPDHARAFKELVPDSFQANLRALDFYVQRGDLDPAAQAWERLLRNPVPRGFSLTASNSFAYIDALLGNGRVAEAQRTWLQALRIQSGSRFGETYQQNPSMNLVHNGSFEEEILDGGFDWRLKAGDGASIRIDPGDGADKNKSLNVTFNEANVDFDHFYQIVPVPSAGRYRLEYRLKTEGLTTDQKPYLQIETFPRSQDAILRTALFPADSPWTQHAFSFELPAGTALVKLVLRRLPSARFDNSIRGSLGLDDVAIRLEANEGTAFSAAGEK